MKTLEELQRLDNNTLDGLIADLQGWSRSDVIEPAGGVPSVMEDLPYWYDKEGNFKGVLYNYHPAQEVEAGRGQCFALMVKYHIEPTYLGDDLWYCDGEYNNGKYWTTEPITLLKAIVIASILATQEKQK